MYLRKKHDTITTGGREMMYFKVFGIGVLAAFALMVVTAGAASASGPKPVLVLSGEHGLLTNGSFARANVYVENEATNEYCVFHWGGELKVNSSKKDTASFNKDESQPCAKGEVTSAQLAPEGSEGDAKFKDKKLAWSIGTCEYAIKTKLEFKFPMGTETVSDVIGGVSLTGKQTEKHGPACTTIKALLSFGLEEEEESYDNAAIEG
jgi:hypothetical protein